MPRWHEPSCDKPVVEVDNEQVPRCLTCGRRCLWKDVLDSSPNAGSALDIPEGDPRGHMNLYWPSSVPYEPILAESDLATPTSPVEAGRTGKDGHAKSAHQGVSDAGRGSPIYSKPLATNEIRLVFLSAVDDEHSLIHLSLGAFADENCPEYETVSYTWGGEEGDYSFSHPIFVGPFWDILFQTKNCTDMLRFVRPWQGIRTIWVDALCINQSDVEERGRQVAKMGQIYEHCTRVIVYLGSDLAPILPEGSFPSRHPLRRLENGSVVPKQSSSQILREVTLENLLKRQYFNRIWVIQELLLAPGAVIRVGDVDFWTDSNPWPTNVTRWELLPAGWIQYMGKGQFVKQQLQDILQLTSSSRASDPRDKLFGLLGLMESQAEEEQASWVPDYSLSSQHVFVGLFAHCIVNLDEFFVLREAAGLEAPPHSPSWLPRWNSQQMWPSLFNRDYVVQDLPEIDKIILNIHEGPTGPYRVRPMTNLLDNAKTWFPRGPQSDKSVTVCSRTGGLRVKVLRLCTIPVSPRLVAERGSLKIFKVSGARGGLYITSAHPLDDIVKPGRDRIFLLVRKKEFPIVPLLMREGQAQGVFTIIAPLTTLHLYSNLEKAFATLGRGSFRNIDYHISMAGDQLRRPIMRGSSLLFAGAEQVWELFPLLKEMKGALFGSRRPFEAAYLAGLDQKLTPRIVDGYLVLTISGRSMMRRAIGKEAVIFINDAVTIETTPIQWEYRAGDTWVPMPQSFPGVVPIDEEFIVGVPMEAVVEACGAIFGVLLGYLETIRHVLNIDWEKVRDVVMQGSPSEHGAKLCPTGSDFLALEEFDLAHSLHEVVIL